MRKKILQLNVTANWGSTGKIAEAIGSEVLNAGWDSVIAYGRYSNSSKSQLIKVGNKLDVYTHYIEQFFSDNEGLCSRAATKKLISQIKCINPDIVHLHNIHDHWLNYQLLFDYLNTTDIKVVLTFHDCWAFTGHCFHFVTKGCDRWKNGCFDCPLKSEYPKTLVDNSRSNYALKRKLFTGCENLTVVCCSNWMAELVRESFLKDKRIEVIHNGIDLNVFKHDNCASRVGSQFNILAVSNVWNKQKGLEDIFELRKLLPFDYQFTIVGLSEKQIKSLPEGIKGIERTGSVDDLVKLYCSSDVLINTSYADTFPTVNLEALACGIPVITYRTGGSPEAIDSKTGVVVAQGNVDEMCMAIRKLRNEPLQSKDCRLRAELYFNKDKCFKKYIDLYQSIL